MEKSFNRETAQVITGHTSFETGFLQTDYPWGFQFRTERKSWIETKVIKKSGEIQMRYVHCTKNPKTGRWCKPKAGTYNAICILMVDDKEFVSYDALYSVNQTREGNEEFVSKYKEFITPECLEQIEKGNIFNDKMKELYSKK